MIKIKKDGGVFLEVFNPKYRNLFLGSIIVLDNGSKIFVTHIKKPEKHFFIKEKGYPINLELLKKLESIGVKNIVIREDSSRFGMRMFISSVYDYLSGVYVKEHFVDTQMVIPLQNLKTINNDEGLIDNA